jgi:hypothetical protein
MVLSTDRTSTSRLSAAAADPVGTGGASGEDTAAGRPPHASSRRVAAAAAPERGFIVARYIEIRFLDRKRLQNKHFCARDLPHVGPGGIFPGRILIQAWRSPIARRFYLLWFHMIREMREKLSREVDQLSHELNVLLPQAIAQAVELGDLRENSEYKAALERQQFVQARLGQLHHRLSQLGQLANHEAPADRVGLGS